MSKGAELVKPRWRGVLHQYAFFVSLGAGTVLVLAAGSGAVRLATAIYALALSGLLGVSALYHRLNWRPAARRWMRRLDHSMILVLIAGTYTPFALVVLDGTLSDVVLGVVWGAAGFGAVVNLFWVTAPKWVTAVFTAAIGWVLVAVAPELARDAGIVVALLMLAGGLLYSAGAVVYALGRPDPAPAVFGYHEIFHVLVILAAALHFAGVSVSVLPTL